MQTVKQIQNIPKETDLAKFPDSNVINETDDKEGSPVIRETYGFLLTNAYAILRKAGVAANGLEDNELNGYQLMEALRKLPNLLNDTEQQLNLIGNVFSVNLDISVLPDKYFLFVRSVEDYVAGVDYTFKGTAATAYGFTSPTGFKSGETVLLILDQATVRAYSLDSAGASSADLFTVFGTPLAYNSGSKIWYQSEGYLFSDKPEVYDLQSAIQLLEGSGTTVVYEMLCIANCILCLSFNYVAMTYRFYKFSVDDLNTPVVINLIGGAFTAAINRRPHIYTDGTRLYITNSTGNSDSDNALDIYTIDMAAGVLTKAGSVNLNAGFEKTTNAAIVAGLLYTFVAGEIKQYNIGTGAYHYGARFPSYLGNIFKLADKLYYSNGEVAKQWILPAYN